MPVLNKPGDAAAAFQSVWNAHDMGALGDLFTADATFVNRFGRYVRGVHEIIAMHAPIHETIYRDSILENELIDVTYIGEDVAVVHFWSRLSSGTAHPAGPHQVDTVILTVLAKQKTSWRICALENVTVTDPRTGEAILRENPTG
ncbi:MAG TPA: SgcJ/EcaC family oxidoreductase [Gemmatimonadaceae bacterium]|nr:SgcJ/EcaC family oxidoreductase [Gemmatimonadaceae bacterium]